MIIEFVSTSEITAVYASLGGASALGPNAYETWKRLHNSVCEVAKRYGCVSWHPNPLPDFYFSGDWFDPYCDSFALYSLRCISSRALHEFRQAVAAHHEDAYLHLGGLAEDMDGLEILITSSRMLVGWKDIPPDECRRKLEQLGIRLE